MGTGRGQPGATARPGQGRRLRPGLGAAGRGFREHRGAKSVEGVESIGIPRTPGVPRALRVLRVQGTPGTPGIPRISGAPETPVMPGVRSGEIGGSSRPGWSGRRRSPAPRSWLDRRARTSTTPWRTPSGCCGWTARPTGSAARPRPIAGPPRLLPGQDRGGGRGGPAHQGGRTAPRPGDQMAPRREPGARARSNCDARSAACAGNWPPRRRWSSTACSPPSNGRSSVADDHAGPPGSSFTGTAIPAGAGDHRAPGSSYETVSRIGANAHVTGPPIPPRRVGEAGFRVLPGRSAGSGPGTELAEPGLRPGLGGLLRRRSG